MARVLVISSHVAFGSVGLAAMVPALHRLGIEVIVLPTVVLSNHPGHTRVLPASRSLASADRRHARRPGGQRLARRHRGGDHFGLPALARTTSPRRARPSSACAEPTRTRSTCAIRFSATSREGLYLSEATRLRHPRRAAAPRHLVDAEPFRAVVAGRPRRRRSAQRRARRRGPSASLRARAPPFQPRQSASPTCSSPKQRVSSPATCATPRIAPRTAPAICLPRCISPRISSTARSACNGARSRRRWRQTPLDASRGRDRLLLSLMDWINGIDRARREPFVTSTSSTAWWRRADATHNTC